MSTVVTYRFRVRRRTAASWVALNEVLLDSEIGLEIDTRAAKIGDGVTPWNDLLYSIPGLIDLTGIADGDTLVWDESAGKFVAAAGGGGGGGGGDTTMGAVFSLQSLAGPDGIVAFGQANGGGTITSATVMAAPGQAGDIVIDVRKSTYANYPGSMASICAAAKPTLIGANKTIDTVLTGWTVAFDPGDCFLFVVESHSGLQDVTITLGVSPP